MQTLLLVCKFAGIQLDLQVHASGDGKRAVFSFRWAMVGALCRRSLFQILVMISECFKLDNDRLFLRIVGLPTKRS
jgi:hypothetical protein